MVCDRLTILVIAFFTLHASVSAATWYVRPSVHSSHEVASPGAPIPDAGVYGDQDGSSYANAWNGLESIAWGAGGVVAGDTLYICGAHIYTLENDNYPSIQALINVDSGGSGCTIRMDYESDPGFIFGGAFDAYNSSYEWQGPDENGVYSAPNEWPVTTYMCWQVNGTNITRLATTNAATWAGGLGTWYHDASSNYVKTITGVAPGTNFCVNGCGWRLNLPIGTSNITFQSCTFIGGGVLPEIPTYPAGDVPLNYAANNITFKDCVILDCNRDQVANQVMLSLRPGNDYWKFDGCEIGYGPSAIYTSMGYQSGTNQTRGIYGLTVTNCYIHDLDTINYPAVDGHAIGAQDNNDCVFIGNRIERTGTAIALFAYGTGMSNNLVSRNFITDVHWHNAEADTGGEGIWISSGFDGMCPSNRVTGNIVLNAGLPGTGSYESWMGSGIAWSPNDHAVIWNNTVVNANHGIYVNPALYAANADIRNNVVVTCTNSSIWIGNVETPTITSDYNLTYDSPAIYIVGSPPHDSHSVIGSDPLFISASPSVATDFRLQSGSPARGAGTDVDLTVDYAGTAWRNPPSIGAYEYLAPAQAGTLRVNSIRGR